MSKEVNLTVGHRQTNTVKSLILAVLDFRDSIYYTILESLMFAFLLAGLSNTLK